MINKIFNEDCLVGMKRIPDNSIDLIVTDPPYNISKENNFNTMKNANRQGLDFGEWDKNADILSFIGELNRITTKNASVIIFNSWLNLGDIAKELEKNNFVVKDCIRLIKNNPMPRNRDRRYIADYEFACLAVKKGAKWIFNRQDKSYQRPEFKTSIVKGKERIHPTQKQVDVIQNLIEIHSNVDDVILDPFMGSGTTAIACLNTNRKYVGFELDKNYYELSSERINNHKNSSIEKLF